MLGEADISVPAALLGDPGRARICFALADGRALPASVLAAEAAVAPSTASGHLGRLLDAGLVRVERHGRHRYYRLSGPEVARALEALAQLAPPEPVRSLRQGTRARLIRDARLCYDHVGGRLGVGVMQRLLALGALTGGDGRFDPASAQADRLSAPGHDVPYRLTGAGARLLTDLGVDVEAAGAGRRPLIRYCLDWSEQRHHLAGALGAALAARMLAAGWVVRVERTRAVRLTPAGRAALDDALGLELAAVAA